MTLRNRLLASLGLATALLAQPALAQQSLPTPQPVQAEPAAPELRPALWKVADADTTIYLFGTVHLLPKGMNWYHGPVASSFEQSAELVTEIPDVDPARMQNVLLSKGVLPSGKSLRGMMTKKEKAKYEAALKQLGLPVEAFDRFKPWYAAVVMSTLPLVKEGYDVSSGVEQQLHERNVARKAPRSGLETLEFQLGLFDGLPLKTQKRYLIEAIDMIPRITPQINKMVDAWGKGDPAALAAIMNEQQSDPAMMKALLTDRNKTWSGWIKQRLDTPGTVFVAVGAGHLGGKGSVQEFLGKQGVAVTRVQ
jgi:uncharacterized protein